MTQRNGKEWQMRQRLAQEAAHILAETGDTDYYAAKRKAALHLGAADTRNMPSNSEIDQALREYQRLFRSDSQPRQLQHLRKTALQAMQFFADYSPRLVGSVLDGTADQHSAVTLHVFAHAAEEIDIFLMQHKIPHEQAERRLRFSADKVVMLPVFRFLAEDVRVELVVFSAEGSHQPPLSPIDGRPMQRATLEALQALIDGSNTPANR